MAASFVLALFGTLRLSPKAVVGFILLPPGRRRSQDGFGSIATSEKLARAKSMRHYTRRRRSQDALAKTQVSSRS